MKQKTGRKLLSFLLTLAMVVGLMPGMGLTAYAAQETKTVTWNYATWEAIRSGNTTNGIKFTGYKSGGNLYDYETTVFNAPAGYEFTQIEFPTTGTGIGNGEAANGGTFSVVNYTFDSTQDGETVNGQKVTWTGKSDTVSFKKDTWAIEYITFTMVGEVVGVESISINQSALNLTVGGDAVALTATVSPNNATDKKVKWSVNNSNVALYSNEACTTAVGTNATDILTVYAKGMSEGSAIVTVTSNADDTKSTSRAVTVNKANPTAPTGLTATYGQTLKDVTLPTGWTWADSAQSVGNVGSNTFKANFAGDANHNAASNVDVTMTVSKAAAQTIADVTDTLLYTATSVSESVADKMPDDAGTLTYTAGIASKTGSVTVSDFAVDANGNVTATLSGGAAGDIVTLPVTISSTNYADSTVNVKITLTAKGKQTISAEDVTVTYGDTGKSVSATVTDPATGYGAISYAVKDGSGDYIDVDASTGALTIKKIGTAVVVVTAAETDTCALATKEVTVTIDKGEGGGTPSANTLVYNGYAQELVTAGKAKGGTMQYALGVNADTAPEASAFNASIPTGVDAKTYYVWYKVKGDANHNDTDPKCVEATIAKKGLTVTADAKSKTQGEADPALTYTASGLVGSDTITGALSREAGEDPGTYAITQGTLTAGDNYEITFTSAVLTINKKDEPATPVPSGGGSSGGGGGYYGGGTVQNQRRDAYSDVIGAAETNFRDSSPERIHNIELACEKLDGIILQPGEVFSFNEALGGLTAEAGFAVAPVNPDDEATAEIGGGVSQVASTLYTGSLFALLETVERTNHPFAVPFIQPGTDAYVTDPGNADALDLKFRNTRGEPIRISAKTRVDEARQVREIVIELQSALGSSDYMPIRFDNTWGGDQNAFLTETPYDLTRPGYRILLTHEEQQFTDASGAGIRTLTHRKILDAAGMLVRDEILNSKLPDGSYAMDTYYQG